MLVVDNLTIIIDDWTGRYDLTVPRGALAAMVGPSGGGKSTLLHAIAGFEKPASGRLSFGGIDLLPLKPADRPVAIVFQDHNLLPNLTALQNAGLALSPSLRLSAADRQAISAMLDHVDLAGMEARLPSELSGGQRQRVALARAMLTTRPLLLLDEPLTGLDPTMRADMIDLIDTLRREKNLTVLMTTHTPEDVEGRADQVITVADGRVVG
ncbi:ATP-binding cassette domain-containing protein [Labrys neptuniae]|uniref:thiamine ABC transporter ATP-binding protein n=1 Tax=Labrys neptuniae TaxID=376174 RepID=UPI00288F34EE|nr:ATP-binding cassette domain-containing protein [Labrys neptuniae]MDT3376053.1 ATP-binding cassette domain-containing protein [Labrys neptuniae]